MSARNTTEKRRNSPGGSHTVLKKTSLQNWWGSQQGKAPAGLAVVNREGLVGDVTVGDYPGHGDHMTWWQSLKKRQRYLITSLLQSSIVRLFFLRGPSSLSWKTGTESTMNPHNPRAIGQWQHWDKSILPDGIHPKSTGGTGGRADQAILYHLSGVLAQWGGLRWLEGNQCNTHLQGVTEGQEGGAGELQACQPNFRLQSRSPGVPTHGTYRTAKGSGPDNTGLWWTELNLAGSCLQVVLSRAWYWGQSHLISLSMIWVRW